MNDLGVLLVGLAARGTVVAALGIVLAVALRRLGPAVVASVLLTSLTVLAGLAALAPLPWPDWGSLVPQESAKNTPEITKTRPADERVSDSLAPSGSPNDVTPTAEPAEVDIESRLTALTVQLGREFGRPGAGGIAARRWGWPSWLALAFFAGFAGFSLRLGLGLLAVGQLRRRSRIVEVSDNWDLEPIRAALGIHRPVEVRVSAEITTPATVGWRHPAILLPDDWTAWDDRERRAVLAHELAHVHRGDYAAGVWAQVCAALHFYNPLAHWLLRRLRLQQELAADAWARRSWGATAPTSRPWPAWPCGATSGPPPGRRGRSFHRRTRF